MIKSIFRICLLINSISALGYSQSDYVTIANKADSLRRSGEYKLSIPLYTEVLSEIDDTNFSEKHKYLVRIGLSHFHFGETDKAYNSYISIIEETKDDTLNIFRAHALNNLGLLYDNQGDYKKSIKFYEKAHSIYQVLDNAYMVDLVNMNIGILLKKEGKYKQSLEKLSQAIKGFKVRKNMKQLAESYSSMGGIRDLLGTTKEAKQLYYKSIRIRKEEIDDDYGLSSVYNNLGIIYMKSRQLDSAEHYFKQAVGLILGKSNRNIGSFYHNLGLIYNYKNDFYTSKEYFMKALEVKLKIEDTTEMIITLNKMGLMELNNGSVNKAYEYLNWTSQLLSKKPNNRYLKENFDYKKEYYKKIENKDSALFCLEQSNKLMKEMSNTAYLKEIALLQESFDAESRYEEIESLSFDNKEKEKNIQNAHKKISNLNLIVGSTVFIILFLGVVMYVRRLQEGKRKLKAKLDGIEQEKRRLSIELHDVAGNQLRDVYNDVKAWISNEKNNSIKSELFKLSENVKNVMHSTISISHELRLPDFGASPLTTIISDRVYDWFENKKYQYTVVFDHREIINNLDFSFGKHIDRFIHESLTNVEKHTNATEIKISTELQEGFIIFTVSDNGKGITSKKPGIGHRNMRDRAKDMSGEFKFISSEIGSKSVLSVPIK